MKNQGFTLLEVLIALVVFSFGLLALAALMAKGLQYNTSALHRSYASSQAYDMADRMRANRLALESPFYYQDINPPAGDPPGCLCNEACDCGTEAMATFDAWQWNRANAAVLPSGSGTVEKKDGTDYYVISVSWTENRLEDAGGSEKFEFEFQP